ncbi:PfkB family carbohydrate kinase [Candidatus Bipolaricaulota bacterium]|nr:PfkB family carbohydrate kinase [Candidatus Bipolaricaulota bacterium]
MRSRYDVVAIGHLDNGRIVKGEEVQEGVGGAVYFGGIVLARLGLRVAVVTRLAQADAWMLRELEGAGIDVFPIWTEESTGIENYYPDPDSDFRRCRPLGFAGTFRPGDLPEIQGRLYYLGTVMAGEIDLPFLRAVAAQGPVALDAQGCLRAIQDGELVTDGWDWAEEALPLVHYLKVDDREALALTGERDLERAARQLAALGAREIVLTHGGGVLVLAEGEVHQAPFRPRSLAGRTGRGDTCFASYLARRLQGASPEEAAKFAAALTTLKLEQPGPFRGSVAEVEKLAAEL